MSNNIENVIVSYVEDDHVLACHVTLYPGERGEREAGLLITPDIAPEAEVTAVYYKGTDVTFLCSEGLLDAIGDQALAGNTP